MRVACNLHAFLKATYVGCWGSYCLPTLGSRLLLAIHPVFVHSTGPGRYIVCANFCHRLWTLPSVIFGVLTHHLISFQQL